MALCVRNHLQCKFPPGGENILLYNDETDNIKMRYKRGIKRSTLERVHEFREFGNSILPINNEQTQSMLGLNEVRHFIDFTRKERDIFITSRLKMPLDEEFGDNPQSVLSKTGKQIGVFDFHWVELGSNKHLDNVFFIK